MLLRKFTKKAPSKKNPKVRGFTLVEVMIVLVIAVIIMSIGIPSVMGTIASNRVTAASNGLVTALNLAKSEAIRSQQNVILCKSANGTQCGDNSVSWADGWILFYDEDGNQSVDAGEKIIRIQAAPHTSLNFVFKTDSGNSYISFEPNGRKGYTNEEHFCFRNSYDESISRKVIISPVGRIQTEKESMAICNA